MFPSRVFMYSLIYCGVDGCLFENMLLKPLATWSFRLMPILFMLLVLLLIPILENSRLELFMPKLAVNNCPDCWARVSSNLPPVPVPPSILPNPCAIELPIPCWLPLSDQNIFTIKFPLISPFLFTIFKLSLILPSANSNLLNTTLQVPITSEPE